MPNKENKAVIGLISSMLIFGTIGIFRKFIPLPSGILAMSRGLIGALFLIFTTIITKKGFDTKTIKKNLFLLILSGAMIGFNWILLFEAYNYTSVATATLCYYAAPVFVILASPVFLKEKLTVKKITCIGISLLGMILVSGIFNAGFSGIKELIGVFLGLGAALLYASVIIMNKKIKNLMPYDKTTVQLASAAFVLIPYILLCENISSVKFDVFSLAMLIFVGIVHTGIAYALYFGSMDRISAQTVAIFSYIDPVVAIILSAVILKENIGISGYIGAVLILGAAMINEMPQKNN